MNSDITLRQTTNGVAVSGLFIWEWLPSIEQVSSYATHLVPILSALWLGIQIVNWIAKGRSGRRGD